MKRHIVAAVGTEDVVLAICNDGTVYRRQGRDRWVEEAEGIPIPEFEEDDDDLSHIPEAPLRPRERHRKFGITVGELIEHLSVFDKDSEITMGGLEFNRTKRRGEKLVQVEFRQQVYQDETGAIIVEEID